ncbi:MAG: hypothetical protein WCO10_03765 [bacterium]
MFNFIQTVYAQVNVGGAESVATKSTGYAAILGKIITNVVNPIIYLMFAVAVIYFLWGVFKFIRNSESDAAREEGGKHILFGVLGLFIMVAVYGIIHLVIGTIRN